MWKGDRNLTDDRIEERFDNIDGHLGRIDRHLERLDERLDRLQITMIYAMAGVAAAIIAAGLF